MQCAKGKLFFQARRVAPGTRRAPVKCTSFLGDSGAMYSVRVKQDNEAR